jgi:hypothetical protein
MCLRVPHHARETRFISLEISNKNAARRYQSCGVAGCHSQGKEQSVTIDIIDNEPQETAGWRF